MTHALLVAGVAIAVLGGVLGWTNHQKLVLTVGGTLLCCGAVSLGEPLRFAWADLAILGLVVAAACSTWRSRSSPLPHVPPSRMNGYLPSLTRSDGVLTLLCYAVLAVMAQQLSPLEVRWAYRVVVAASVGVAAIALLQARGRLQLCLPGGVSDGAVFQRRAWGTMCNPLFLGGYLCLVWPLAVLLREWWAWGAACCLLAALIASGTRSAWVASAAALVVVITLADRPLSWFPFAGVIGSGLPIWFQAERFRWTTTMFDLLGAKESGRRYIWKVAWAQIKERPWLGWGYNTMQIKNPDPAAHDHYDHAHNQYLGIAHQTGLVGATAYLTVWAFGIAHAGILLPSLIAYALWALFGWDHLGPANLLWFMLGVNLGR